MMYNYGGGMGWGMWFIPILIVLVIYLLIRSDLTGNKRGPGTETPMDILKKRYARGEISKEEFNAMKQDLM